MNNFIIRKANQDDLETILNFFMKKKDDFFDHKAIKHKVGLTLHKSIHTGLCVIGYNNTISIPIGYCVGIQTEDLWNYDKTVYLASVYIFEDFRKTKEAKQLILFWSRIAKNHGNIKWAIR